MDELKQTQIEPYKESQDKQFGAKDDGASQQKGMRTESLTPKERELK